MSKIRITKYHLQGFYMSFLVAFVIGGLSLAMSSLGREPSKSSMANAAETYSTQQASTTTLSSLLPKIKQNR
jgi:hypothetical protein